MINKLRRNEYFVKRCVHVSYAKVEKKTKKKDKEKTKRHTSSIKNKLKTHTHTADYERGETTQI